MSEHHSGGCLCGALRYRTHGVPVRTAVCHCTFCQRRTGSATAPLASFPCDRVELKFDNGALGVYEHRSDESQRWLRMHFCKRCATTVMLTLEKWPGICVIAGGSFDERDWFAVERHVWTRSAQRWVGLPEDVECFAQAATG